MRLYVGEIHRRGDLVINSRSPLSEPFFGEFKSPFYFDVGEITQGVFFDILVLQSVFLHPRTLGHLAGLTIYTGLGDVLG